MAIRERWRMKDPYFYRERIFKLAPIEDKSFNVLGAMILCAPWSTRSP
jgi:hypothetical protein